MNRVRGVDLSIGYSPGKPLIEDAEFTLGPGLHVLIGANGSGKSTLLKTIAGIIKPLKGSVEVNGVNIHDIRRREAVRLVGYVWQNPFHGFIEATVEREISFITRMTGARVNGEILYRLVDMELMDRNPFTLSGGEARRVALASVLSIDQPVWLLDEPFSDLDYNGYLILAELIRYGVKNGKVIVMTTHIVSLLDPLEPNTFLLIDRGRRRLLRGEWRDLTDDLLLGAGIIPRRISCGTTI